MVNVRHVPCGACGSDLPQPLGVPLVSEQAKAVTLGWEEMRVVYCTQCGFLYTDPMPFWEYKDVQTLYNVEYFGHESVWWHHVRTEVDPQRRLDAIEKEGGGFAPRLLDIGCGQGYVLEHALQRGWDVWGLEPSQVWAEQTSTRLGVKIWINRVEEAEVPPESCDIVFSDSVIEHLPEPIVMMNFARRVLKRGGIAYFVTPRADALVNHFRRFLFRLVGSQRSPYIEPLRSPYHLVGFTPCSLTILAERSGFEVRHLWVRHGSEEWHKEKRWTLGKFKSVALWPTLLLGQLVGKGTTIEVLLIRQ